MNFGNRFDSYEKEYYRSTEEIRKLQSIIYEQKMEIQELKAMVYQQQSGYWQSTKACHSCSASLPLPWYSHYGGLCRGCYESKRSKVPTDISGECIVCRVKESIGWHYDQAGAVCRDCDEHSPMIKYQNETKLYSKYETPKKQSKFCSDCGVSNSSCWYKDRKKQTGHLCRKCYTQQNLTRIDVLPDGTIEKRSCFGCSSQETTSWYNVPDHVGKFHCIRCYHKRRTKRGSNNTDKESGVVMSSVDSHGSNSPENTVSSPHQRG
jgi:hypothetical protein